MNKRIKDDKPIPGLRMQTYFFERVTRSNLFQQTFTLLISTYSCSFLLLNAYVSLAFVRQIHIIGSLATHVQVGALSRNRMNGLGGACSYWKVGLDELARRPWVTLTLLLIFRRVSDCKYRENACYYVKFTHQFGLLYRRLSLRAICLLASVTSGIYELSLWLHLSHVLLAIFINV